MDLQLKTHFNFPQEEDKVRRDPKGTGEAAQWLRACSERGPGFDSQHPHGGSQPLVTPVPGFQFLLLTSTSSRHICGVQTPMQAKHSNTCIHQRTKGWTLRPVSNPPWKQALPTWGGIWKTGLGGCFQHACSRLYGKAWHDFLRVLQLLYQGAKPSETKFFACLLFPLPCLIQFKQVPTDPAERLRASCAAYLGLLQLALSFSSANHIMWVRNWLQPIYSETRCPGPSDPQPAGFLSRVGAECMACLLCNQNGLETWTLPGQTCCGLSMLPHF